MKNEKRNATKPRNQRENERKEGKKKKKKRIEKGDPVPT